MNKVVIFDCDGVLVDSEPLTSRALIDCLADLQIVVSLEDAVRRFRGRRLADCILEIEKSENCLLPAEFESTLRQRMSDYFESQLQAITGVEEAVKKIPHRKCVASNGPLPKTKRNLEIAGLIRYFGDSIFSAYTIQKWKPEPDLFLHACREMRSQPDHCIVVEDSALGVQAALAGGFRVLAYGLDAEPQVGLIPFTDMRELPRLVEQALSAE